MAWVLKMEDATIESGLVHDFDASLSGIGQELGAGAYSMRSEPRPAATWLPSTGSREGAIHTYTHSGSVNITHHCLCVLFSLY